MTGPEFAAHVGISYRTALRMRQAGEGPPAYRVGRVWRYLRKDVDLWLSRLPTAGGTS